MIKIISLLSFLMLIFSQPNLLSAAMTSNNYQIWQDAISVGGGEDQSSANYGLQDTLGELAVDPSSSTNNALKPGFRSNQFFSGQQTLTFSVSPATLEFGKLDKSSTAMGSVVLSVETNSYTGVSVTYGGNTLTCGACTSNPKEVSAIGSGASAANAGSSQFGFNAIYSSGSSPVASALSISISLPISAAMKKAAPTLPLSLIRLPLISNNYYEAPNHIFNILIVFIVYP